MSSVTRDEFYKWLYAEAKARARTREKMILLNPMTREQASTLEQELNEYARVRYKHKSSPRHCYLSHASRVSTFDLRRAQYRMYCRIYHASELSWPCYTIAIANISFRKKRVGHATDFLRLLCRLAPVYDWRQVGIEKTNDASRALALKYGFEAFENKNYSDCYIISVAELAKNLGVSRGDRPD